MNHPAILDSLASHAFLHGLSVQQRMRIVSAARPFTVSPGDYLAREGQPAHAFYLIQSGQVAIDAHLGDRDIVTVQNVGPGEVVGWSWLLPPYRWQFDARATEPVHGMSFDGNWLRELCEHDHDFGYHLLKELLAVVSGRLAASRLQSLNAQR